MVTALLLEHEVVAGVLVFCRVGALLASVPILGDRAIPMRIRLLLYVAVALVIYLALGTQGAVQGQVGYAGVGGGGGGRSGGLWAGWAGWVAELGAVELLLVVAREVALGYGFGVLVRIIHAVIHTVSFLISSQAGLSSASLFDPAQNSDGTVISGGLGMICLAFLLACDMHLFFVGAVAKTYEVFALGTVGVGEGGGGSSGSDGGAGGVVIGEMLPRMVALLSQSWVVALQMAAPLVVASFILILGAGILGRLMPQLQIFFLVLPVQILLGFLAIIFFLSYGLAEVVEMYHELFRSG